MKKMEGLAVALCACGLFLSCQTNKGTSGVEDATWPISPGTSIIQSDVSGFSPTSETGITTISFSLYFANPTKVEKWSLMIADLGGKKIMKRTGGNSNLPSNIAWDGKDDSGKYAAENTYVAILTVNYGKAFTESTVTSAPFVLDTTRPAAQVRISPAYFSPISETDKVGIAIAPKQDLAKIDSWGVEIYDPAWNLFMTFNAKWPINSVFWDGRGMDGDLVVSAEDYPVIVRLRDEFGNSGSVNALIPVDIIVVKDGDNYRIENSRVYFKDFTADYQNVPVELSEQNILRLDQLAEQLKKYPEHRVVIVGHAVMMNWNDDALGKVEQEEVLVPLSKARAEAIKKAMITRGVDPAMITTEGAGASDPLVPNSDLAYRWKNRRTVIFLIK